jgi:hypothetical protein
VDFSLACVGELASRSNSKANNLERPRGRCAEVGGVSALKVIVCERIQHDKCHLVIVRFHERIAQIFSVYQLAEEAIASSHLRSVREKFSSFL